MIVGLEFLSGIKGKIICVNDGERIEPFNVCTVTDVDRTVTKAFL